MRPDDEGFAAGEFGETDPPGQLSRLQVAAWTAFPLFALVAFEWSADPLVASVVFCVKFGMPEFVVAIWLPIRDPSTTRGLICGLQYLSFGALKVLILGVLLGLVASGVIAHFWPRGPIADPTDAMLTVGLIAMATATLLSLTAWAGALFVRQRLWLSGGVLSALMAHGWPPRPAAKENQLGGVVLLNSLVIGAVGLLGVAVAADGQGPAGNWMLAGGILLVVLTLAAMIETVRRWIAAERPEDCWPDEETDGDDGAGFVPYDSRSADFVDERD
ncbi:MAG: hypothetical protein KF774_02735 [Planctomyces sp.]|nr:hypothetical protein [Planctomyces sp.]